MLPWLVLTTVLMQAPPKPPPADPQKPPAETVLPTYAETVVVTASRTEEKLVNAPASVSVVPRAQIESSPASTIAEVLQGVVGVNVFRSSARELNVASRQPAAALGTGQLVLLDGRVVNNGSGGMYWDQLPVDLDEIEQIEIVHGPASVVWGSNALSGVINLRTRSPREIQGLRFMAGIGEAGERTGGVRWAGASDKISYKFSASLYHHDAWPRSPTLPDGSPATGPLAFANPDFTQPKADFRLDYEPGENRVWSVRAGYGGTSGILLTNDLPFEFPKSTYMSFADVSYRSPSVDGRVYWTRSAGGLKSLIDGSTSPFRADFPTVEINTRKPLAKKQLLVAGASARFDFFDVAPIPNRHTRHEFGAYLEDQIFPNAHLQLNLGARLDGVQTSGAAVSPRASVLVKPTSNQAVRFSISRAYRPPNPIENFLELSTGYPLDLAPGFTVLIPFAIVGNEKLDEARSLGIEGGYTGVLHRRHTLQATVYRIASSDTIQLGNTEFYSPASPPSTWPFPPSTVPPDALPKTASYRNTGTIESHGLELSMNSAWPRAFWSAFSYTYQSKPDVSDVAPGFAIAVNDPPRHQASVLVGWNQASWRGSVGAVYTARAFWTDVVVADPRLHGFTKPYTLMNASVAYRIANSAAEVAVKATNLFNQQVQQHVFGDIIGRQVSVQLRVDLKTRR